MRGYVAARLGEVNAQTRWALERSGAPEPELLHHVHLRARDVMRQGNCPTLAGQDASLRDVGLVMAGRRHTTWSQIADEAGAVVGIDHRPQPRPPLHQGVRRAVQLRRPAGVAPPDRRCPRGRDAAAARAAPERPGSGRLTVNAATMGRDDVAPTTSSSSATAPTRSAAPWSWGSRCW